MLKTIVTTAAFAFLVTGCVTATPIITPSGQQGFTVDCSATGDIGQCYKKAGSLCGGAGYEVFNQNNTEGGFWTNPNRTMVVRCKAPGE